MKISRFSVQSEHQMIIININIMKKNIQSILKMSTLALAVSSLVFFSCSDDDDNKDNAPGLTGETKTYTLTSVGDGNITGTAVFAERTDGSTIVTVNTIGTTSGETYPVYIRSNSAAETGDVLVDLESVAGSTGTSGTILTERNNGTVITYDDLLALNGTLVITTDDETVVSQSDIGSNQVTATSRTYTLASVDESDVTGTVTFAKRLNGNTLITTNLQGTETGTTYPVSIYNSSITTPGAAAIGLTSINGATGSTTMSMTSVSELDAGTAITYDQLNTFNGHIGVGTMGSPTTYVASSNIGSNATP
jgi:hypothetical protein